MKTPNRGVRICIIGSEVLNGFVQDTNSNFFAREMFSRGFDIKSVDVIRDDPEQILAAWQRLFSSGDLVLVSGGLGPTEDDLTVDLLSKYLNTNPVYEPNAERRVRAYFGRRGNQKKGIQLETALKQARYPEGTEALINREGLAPGIWVKDIPALFLPGFPVEIKGMWPQALEFIDSLQLEKKHTEIVPVWGVGESELFSNIYISEKIETGVHALATGCRLFLRERAEGQAGDELQKMLGSIKEKYSAHIIDDPLLAFMGFLKKENKTMATIESCTGGLIGKLITDIPGASQVYPGGFISYANSIKEKLVGIKKETLEKYGAVSEQVAVEMALGGIKTTGADFSIAVTGIAGPDGGSDEKPVGTVYIALAEKQTRTIYCARLYMPIGRERFRKAVVYSAFLALYQRYMFFNEETRWLNYSDRYKKIELIK